MQKSQNKTLILLSGVPSSGKTTLASQIFSHLSTEAHSAAYIPEWVKPHANRNWSFQPFDQPGIFGNQTLEINSAVQAGYEHIICCSSPMLCSFYANHHSHGAFLSLSDLTREWIRVLMNDYQYQVLWFHLSLSEERLKSQYKQQGRFQNLQEVLNLQKHMNTFLLSEFGKPTLWGELTPEECIEQILSQESSNS